MYFVGIPIYLEFATAAPLHGFALPPFNGNKLVLNQKHNNFLSLTFVTISWRNNAHSCLWLTGIQAWRFMLFIRRSHPLMDSAVRHEGDAPAFYKRDLVLTTIVVDRQFVDMLGDDITYTVFYAGTSKSLIASWEMTRIPNNNLMKIGVANIFERLLNSITSFIDLIYWKVSAARQIQLKAWFDSKTRFWHGMILLKSNWNFKTQACCEHSKSCWKSKTGVPTDIMTLFSF